MQFSPILPQDLRATASPTFVGLTATGLTASQVVGTDGDKALVSIPVIGSGLTLSGGNLYWSWLGLDDLSETPDEDSMMVWNGPSAAVLWESGNTLNHTLGLGTEDSPTFVGLTLTGTLGVTGLSTLTGGAASGNIEPITDNTYYLGRNDDDSPKAWKGLILKDQAGTGKYYRVEISGDALQIADLTD
jgi:hypothetical protein